MDLLGVGVKVKMMAVTFRSWSGATLVLRLRVLGRRQLSQPCWLLSPSPPPRAAGFSLTPFPPAPQASSSSLTMESSAPAHLELHQPDSTKS